MKREPILLIRMSAAWQRLRARPASVEDRNIRWLLLMTGIVGVVTGGIITFLPVFLARLGASGMTVSLLTSLPALVTIFLALPAGVIATRWRRIVAVSTAWFYVLRLCYLAVALVAMLRPTLVPALIVIIWAASAIPSTLANAVWYDVVAEAVSPRKRPMVNGLRWALTGLASAISVAGFGQLLQALPFPLNYQVVFFISFLAGIANIWCYSRIEVPEREPAPMRGSPLAQLARPAEIVQPLRANPGFLGLSVITFVMRIGLNLPIGLWSVFWVHNMQASDAWIGWRATVENISVMIGYYCWGRVAGRRHYTWVFAAVTLGLGACMLLAAQATASTRWILLLCAFLGGFSSPGIDVSLFEWLLDVMPAAERPRYVAVNTVLANAVIFVAPLIGGALAQHVGIPPVIMLESLFLFACAALTYRLRRGTGKRVRPAAGPLKTGGSRSVL